MTKLTVGICVYDDYDGAYFTLQSIRFQNRDIIDRLEFVIINNNPKSERGKALHKLTDWIKEPVTYVEITEYTSPFLKGKIFELANTDYVLVMDCHVLLANGCLNKLLDFYDKGLDKGNLLSGPLVYDDFENISTHFDLSKWGSHMWGSWDLDPRGIDPKNKPFEIEAMGMGLFSCRKDSWLGFNPKFRGFGGEEGYIHKKYEMNGKKTLCLPFMRWLHRFERPDGLPYVNDLKDRFRNYMIGFQETKQDTNIVVKQFKDVIPVDYIKKVKKELNLD
jgi:hypothetical protein|tara:strand:- start:4019 stop:4849 length:831 start_codon:yes stop_codon:yes gene_type:complete